MSSLFDLVTALRAAGASNVTFRRTGDVEAPCGVSAVWDGVGVHDVGSTNEHAASRLLAHMTRDEDEPRCCSLCDAPGHGFPGGGPCPLEDRGYMDSFTEEGRREAWLEAEEAAMMEGAS